MTSIQSKTDCSLHNVIGFFITKLTWLTLFLQVQTMEGWEMRAFEINPRTITKVGLPNLNKLTDYGGSLAVVFSQYGPVDLTKATMFFSAPEEYLRSQINSYGAKLSYKVIFGGGYVKKHKHQK